jgi:hypothetical protein
LLSRLSKNNNESEKQSCKSQRDKRISSVKISEKENSNKKRNKNNSDINKENIMMNGTLRSNSFSSKKLK